MAGKVKGGQVKSINSLRKSVKKGSKGSAGFLKRIAGDSSMLVRFLTEPDEWVQFFEHYDQVRKFYPCSDDCPGCAEGSTPSLKYVVNVVDVDEGEVLPLVLTKGLAGDMLAFYDKYETLLDRDYELTRTGSGKDDTEYRAIPESPTRMNLKKYEVLDLWAIVESQLPDDVDDDDDDMEDDEDERPAVRRRPTKKGGTPPPKRRRRPVDDDDDDDDDEDEPVRRRPTKKAAPTRRKPPAKKSAPAKRRSMSRK